MGAGGPSGCLTHYSDNAMIKGFRGQPPLFSKGLGYLNDPDASDKQGVWALEWLYPIQIPVPWRWETFFGILQGKDQMTIYFQANSPHSSQILENEWYFRLASEFKNLGTLDNGEKRKFVNFCFLTKIDSDCTWAYNKLQRLRYNLNRSFYRQLKKDSYDIVYHTLDFENF